MIYEIYSKEGIPVAVEHAGQLEDVVSLIGRSEILYGKSVQGKREAIFVRKGENVLHVSEAVDEWAQYVKIDADSV